MFQSLFRLAQRAHLLEEVKMREYPKDISRHATSRQGIEKLHRLHLEAIVAINHQQDNICNLRYVYHTRQ